MIGDVLSILGTTLMTNVIKSLGENKEQPRTEIVERQVMVPQQPQQQIPPLNFNLTINVFTRNSDKLPIVDARENGLEIDLK